MVVVDRLVVFIGLASLSFGQAAILSVFGPVARDFGLKEAEVGIVISISALVAVFVAPWLGRKSDEIGHQKVFLFAMVANFVTTAGFAALLKVGQSAILMGSVLFLSLLLMRMAYALGASGALPAASGIIARSTSHERLVGRMSLTGTAFSVGSIGGAALTFAAAGTLGALGPIWIACGPAAAAALLAAYTYPSSAKNRHRQAKVKTKSFERSALRKLWRFLLLAVTAYTALGIVQQAIPFFVQDTFLLDTDAAVKHSGLLATAAAISTLVFLQIAGWVAWSTNRLLFIGCFTAMGGLSLLLAPPHMAGLIIVHILFGAGFGLLLPALQALVLLRVEHHQQATASGYLAGSLTLGFVLGPSIGGMLYTLHASTTFLVAFMLIAVSTILALRINCPSLPR